MTVQFVVQHKAVVRSTDAGKKGAIALDAYIYIYNIRRSDVCKNVDGARVSRGRSNVGAGRPEVFETGARVAWRRRGVFSRTTPADRRPGGARDRSVAVR